MKRIGTAFALLLALASGANAQSSPGFVFGDVPTAAQWNSYFAAKVDYAGYTPFNPENMFGTSPIVITTVNGSITISCPTCAASGVTDHAVAVGGASTLGSVGPLTTGQLLLGVTGSDPVACSTCSLADAIAIGGGASGASPSPRITMGSYLDNAGAVSISHLNLYGGTYGLGVSTGQLNFIAASGATHNFYTGADLSNAIFSVGATSININKPMTISGSSSGSTVLSASAAASGTLVLPAASDTLVGKATTDTLTNKTIDTAGTGNSFKIAGTTITSISGNTAKVVTTTGTLTNGDCVSIDGSGNFIAAGGACTTGGGGGTVSAGSEGQLAYYASPGTTVAGNASVTVIAGAVTFGVPGSVVGSLSLANATSGTIKFNPVAGALGSSVITVPAVTDTLAAIAATQALTNKTIDGASNTLTVLAASQLSGNIPVTNLNSGTSASSTTFWRGDGTWVTPATATATDTQVWSATANVYVDGAHLNSAGAIVALSDAATIATDMTTGINFSVTLGGNRTLGAPTNTQDGRSGCYFFTQDGTGSRTLAYNSVWKFSGGTAPTLTTTASAVDMLCYVIKDSTHIIASLTPDVK